MRRMVKFPLDRGCPTSRVNIDNRAECGYVEFNSANNLTLQGYPARARSLLVRLDFRLSE